MKTAATPWYRLVPSMLMVAPTGSTKLETSLSTPICSSTRSMVTGRVAALELVEKASNWAGLIFFIGMMVARIVRDLVVTMLQTVDFDKWANRGGVEGVTGNSAISKTIGTIIYVLIAIPVAIAALEQLGIDSISAPASINTQ